MAVDPNKKYLWGKSSEVLSGKELKKRRDTLLDDMDDGKDGFLGNYRKTYVKHQAEDATPAPPTAQTERERLDAAADEERKRRSQTRGRASTILTGGRGLLEPAPSKKPTLLGS